MTKRKNIIIGSIIGLALVFVVITALVYHGNPGKGTIRVASLLPLDGQVAAYGEMMCNGQTMAMENINTNPNNKHKIKIIFYNTSHQKGIALDRLKEATNSGIRFIAEIFGSDLLDHCLDYARAHNLFIVSGVDTRPDLIAKGKGVFFRLMPNDAAAASFILQWAKELGLNRIGIVYANDVWGEGLRDAAVTETARLGMVVAILKDINRNQSSFVGVVSRLKAVNPDAVLLFIYPDDGGNFLKEARRQQLNSNFFATENFAGSDMVSIAKGASEGVMMVSPSVPKGKGLLKFKKHYHDRFGTEPTIFSLKGYDAVHFIYTIAVESNQDPIVARKLAKNYHGFGITGPISFDKSGEFIPGPYQRLRFIKVGDSYRAVPVKR